LDFGVIGAAGKTERWSDWGQIERLCCCWS